MLLELTRCSESGAVALKRFLAYMQDIKDGKLEGSVLGQSIDYVTADDGESEAVWQALKSDMQQNGLSTHLLEKHRALITSTLTEILPELSQGSPRTRRGTGVEQLSQAQSSTDVWFDANDTATEQNDAYDPLTLEGLFLAARKGRADIIAKAFETWDVPKVTDSEGNTALHVAAAAGNTNVVDVLLTKGCDPNQKGSEGSTPIRLALENGHHAVIRSIIGHSPGSATLDAPIDGMLHRALHYAAGGGDEDALALLLNAGADVKVRNRFEQTPLHFAAWQRDRMAVRRLLDAEADVGAEDFWGDTAFDVAISTPINPAEKAAIIRAFLERTWGLEGDQSSWNTALDLDAAAEFLEMESVYDINSEDNIFKRSAEGADITKLVVKQFEMNDLAEDLWEAIYGSPELGG